LIMRSEAQAEPEQGLVAVPVDVHTEVRVRILVIAVVGADIFGASIALRADRDFDSRAEVDSSAVRVIREVERGIVAVAIGSLQLAVAVAALDVQHRHRRDLGS
jgi:hypothetical protein